MHGLSSIAYNMKFLSSPQSKPCAGKSEGRTRDWFEPKHVLIETAAGVDVADMDGHVIQFVDFHGTGCNRSSCSCKRCCCRRRPVFIESGEADRFSKTQVACRRRLTQRMKQR